MNPEGGYDVRAVKEVRVEGKPMGAGTPMGHAVVPLGFRIECPPGYYIRYAPRPRVERMGTGGAGTVDDGPRFGGWEARPTFLGGGGGVTWRPPPLSKPLWRP